MIMPQDNQTKCVHRLTAGFLFPCPIGVVLHSILVIIIQIDISVVFFLPPMLFFGYIYAGLQSILYSLVMEFLVWRVCGVNYKAIIVSALLGALCGSSLLFTIPSRSTSRIPSFHTWDIIVFSSLGLITGIICGYILYRLKKKHSICGE